ncbi:MAG: FMN-binding glutamate synthase family protein [Candidatus Freyarchaeota archaeon]|nr:FMN-binding glutamate synthase family protein [Candidatus Jordarchaeia archaeon]MBS7270494.1 FMN-binding glutamate synthase family protein [Candidatus Jordarchaeia archaeon]MBS7278553.1 FMN-binding glutamate synthase family protein [Candidatus Jordarchaeia archaeon]
MPEIDMSSKSILGAKTRVKDVSPTSGMCPICIYECRSLCEVGKAAFRGREALYPLPEQYGMSTAASNKYYVVDWSDFQIMVNVLGAEGIEPDPDKAIFPAVDIKTVVGGVKLKIPVFTAGLGSTYVAKYNWKGLAIGAAISGTMQVIGENVCGMDFEAQFTNGKVTHSPDMNERVESFREFWDGEYGDIVVQTNVEDQRLGVDLYALSKLEVSTIERKWGQGAKALGGEVRVTDIDQAITLKKRGYIVIPDPEDPNVQQAFKEGTFKSFERHSRVGMPERKTFLEDVDSLREQGAKRVFLKTGAYKPAIVAFTLKCASEAKIDLVTFDGAGGGTGMSPVPMMLECATPTVFLEAQVLQCLNIMKENNMYIPDIAMAGGFTSETQIFKAIALSNFDGGPFVKAIAMARAPVTAVMKASYFSELAQENALPLEFVKNYGGEPDKFFLCSAELRQKYGSDYDLIPPGAIGLYSYYVDKIGTGLKQLMAGVRKWKLSLLDRNDIASLTDRAKRVTGIPLIEEMEKEAMRKILLG